MIHLMKKFRDLAVRLAVAVPISVGVGVLCGWIGEYSVVVGLLTGLASYLAASWLLASTSSRQAIRRMLSGFLREHWPAVAQAGICLLLCAIFFSLRSEPSEPEVKHVLSIVQFFGPLVIFFVPAMVDMIEALFANTWLAWVPTANLASRYLKGLTAYAMALWLIGSQGDAAYRWIIAQPNNAAIGAASIAILWLIVRFSANASYGPERIAVAAAAPAVPASPTLSKPTRRDERYVAAHEAGHALVYAAIDNLPEGVQLVMKGHVGGDGVLGFITSLSEPHHLVEKSFAEWNMLMFLAGKFGELTLHGESTLGSSSDFQRWHHVARKYLANQYRGVYYADPQNRFEQEQNAAAMEALQTEQLEMLSTLFDTNAEVFRELADALLEKRMLGRDELVSFLQRVKLPEGFPHPYSSLG